MGVELVGDVEITCRRAAFVSQAVPHARRYDNHDGPYSANSENVSQPLRRRTIPTVPKRQLGASADPNEVIGLLHVTMPIGHGAWIQFDPIYLRYRYPDDGPIRSENFSHPAAAREDITELMHPNAGNVRPSCGSAAGNNGLLIALSE